MSYILADTRMANDLCGIARRKNAKELQNYFSNCNISQFFYVVYTYKILRENLQFHVAIFKFLEFTYNNDLQPLLEYYISIKNSQLMDFMIEKIKKNTFMTVPIHTMLIVAHSLRHIIELLSYDPLWKWYTFNKSESEQILNVTLLHKNHKLTGLVLKRYLIDVTNKLVNTYPQLADHAEIDRYTMTNEIVHDKVHALLSKRTNSDIANVIIANVLADKSHVPAIQRKKILRKIEQSGVRDSYYIYYDNGSTVNLNKHECDLLDTFLINQLFAYHLDKKIEIMSISSNMVYLFAGKYIRARFYND